jgi:hypothetical protein
MARRRQPAFTAGLCFCGGWHYCALQITSRKAHPVFKFAFLIALTMPALFIPGLGRAADMIVEEGRHAPNCPSEQSGTLYCVETPPVEKLITDCDAGVDCHHMESGQHYSLQRPVSPKDY